MELKLISFAICIFLVTNAYCSRSVPADLKSRVRLALKLEKSNVNTCDSTVKIVPCPPSKFRSPTGECNNILNRGHGARGDAFLRLLEPSYADGRIQPRTSIGSHALPAADFVVDELQKSLDETVLHPHITAMAPAWGQLLAYDLAEISPLSGSMKCCKNNGKYTTAEEIEQCYVRSGADCKEYKRSVPSVEQGNCQIKHRNQMNLASGFIDGSSLYGSTEKEINSLRLFRAGKVDIRACPRCTESGAVGALHTILLKEHNRIATVLSDKNPQWSDSVLFLEARRILVAQIQHITYNEFLPIILGQQIVNKESLRMVTGTHYNGYSSAIRPGVYNEIATSALPAFLTMLPNGMTNQSTTIETLLGVSAMLKTLKPNDLEFNEYWTPIALAIHRSRDHGIPAYYKALNLCEARLPNVDQKVSFDDLELYGGLNNHSRKVLESIYQNAEDVDLLAGALLETPALGTIFGPTLSCLLSIQFDKLRNSDRFWYENDIPPSSLNLDQLSAIRRVTLSGLLCTAGQLKRSQPKAFIKEDPYLNYRQTCQQLPGLDLSAWQSDEEPELTTEADTEEETVTPAVEELNEDLIKSAIEKAKFDLNERARFEYESWLNSGGLDARSPDGTAASFSKANKNALKLGNSSLFFEFVSNEILNSLQGIHRRKRQIFDTNALIGVFRDDFQNSLQNIDVNSLLSGSISPVSLEPQCEDFTAPCDPTTPYRSLTGHCNNLRNAEWGKSLTTFNRLLPPVYEDGVSRPRQTSVTGIPLPNPRTVSSLIHPDISNLHTRYSLMTMQFAQFLDHDLTMTPIHKGFHESIPKCRSCDSPRTVHPECNPIPIPQGDHFYPDLNVTSGERMCFPFMRSLPGQQTLGPREQINQNTAFLDASQIYGENTCLCNKLRNSQFGRMNSTFHPIKGKELLPRSDQHPECKSPSGYCFIAGDGRASEQPGLTAIHTIFLREHNRIVDGLHIVNPHWDNEKLFQQARRIVSAQNQHITYNEFLPRLLSWNAVNLYGLKLLPQGYYKEYDSTCNPAILTEFAAAAFRIGHSLLRPHIPRLSANHQPIDPPLLLRDFFFKMDALMAPEMMDEIARGLVATPMETLDQFITGEVSNHLFEDRRIPFSGVDLIALNVQRARDHGIPSYNSYRALCNLKRARTWEDLSREIPPEVITRFKRIYSSVDDIDLFPGGMSERPLQGGLVGPTFACIIGIQFRQLRKCDRFWYETDDPNLKFTEAQLNEIRKVTLSKIICENMDNPGDMQRAAFDLPSNFLNPRVPCHTMQQMDFNAWRENTVQGCQIGGRQVGVGQSAFPSPCTSCICTNEGAQCASLRITDCAQLAREWSRDAILADDICSAQCGLLLQNSPSTSNLVGLSVPPSSRITRSRPIASWTTTGFTDFSLPDLTQFIG